MKTKRNNRRNKNRKTMKGGKRKLKRKRNLNRKRRTKHKKQHGGNDLFPSFLKTLSVNSANKVDNSEYQEVNIYLNKLENLSKAEGPASFIEACKEIQKSLTFLYKIKTRGCSSEKEKKDDCRKKKIDALTRIKRKLDQRLQYYDNPALIDYKTTYKPATEVIQKTLTIVSNKLKEIEKKLSNNKIEEPHDNYEEVTRRSTIIL